MRDLLLEQIEKGDILFYPKVSLRRKEPYFVVSDGSMTPSGKLRVLEYYYSDRDVLKISVATTSVIRVSEGKFDDLIKEHHNVEVFDLLRDLNLNVPSTLNLDPVMNRLVLDALGMTMDDFQHHNNSIKNIKRAIRILDLSRELKEE